MAEEKEQPPVVGEFPKVSHDTVERLAKSKEFAVSFVDSIESFLGKHEVLKRLFLGVYGAENEKMGEDMYFGAGVVGALLQESGFVDRELRGDLVHGVMGSWIEEKREDPEAALTLLDTDPNLLAAVVIVANRGDRNAKYMIAGGAILIELYKSLMEKEKLKREIKGLPE